MFNTSKQSDMQVDTCEYMRFIRRNDSSSEHASVEVIAQDTPSIGDPGGWARQLEASIRDSVAVNEFEIPRHARHS